jgi:hypothetical protein
MCNSRPLERHCQIAGTSDRQRGRAPQPLRRSSSQRGKQHANFSWRGWTLAFTAIPGVAAPGSSRSSTGCPKLEP